MSAKKPMNLALSETFFSVIEKKAGFLQKEGYKDRKIPRPVLTGISRPQEKCEKQELNLRTPAGTDLESASVGHLDILAWHSVGF